MPVYNYGAKKVQILEITQKTIQQRIMNLANNPKWGDPAAYDLVVTRTDNGAKTDYTVQPDPKEPVAEEVKKAYQNTPINIEALFAGDDPFLSREEPPVEAYADEGEAEAKASEDRARAEEGGRAAEAAAAGAAEAEASDLPF